MTFALITALQQSDHYTAPWYIAVPIIAVALGFTIWAQAARGCRPPAVWRFRPLWGSMTSTGGG
jgi:hypothetical protein